MLGHGCQFESSKLGFYHDTDKTPLHLINTNQMLVKTLSSCAMQFCYSVLLIAASLIVLSGCSTDLDLNAEYEEIPVVYGLLNAKDSVHYVRIQKAFLGQRSAEEDAKVRDSTYYDHKLDVTVTALDENGNPNGQTFRLNRVNGDTMGLDKESGAFAEDPNELYRFRGNLNPELTYRFTMENPKTGKRISAETPLVQDFKVERPIPAFDLRFLPELSEDFKWDVAPNGKVTELLMRFRYYEWEKGNPGSREAKHIDWRVIKREVTDKGQEQHEVEKGGLAFFTAISNKLNADPDVRRAVDTSNNQKFTYNVGAQDLYNYVRVGEAQTGITELQVTPEYSNFDEGLGIFSSVFTKEVDNIELSEATIDSLACSTFTRDLNFRASNGEFECE